MIHSLLPALTCRKKETRLELNNWTLLYFLTVRDCRQNLLPLLTEFGRINSQNQSISNDFRGE